MKKVKEPNANYVGIAYDLMHYMEKKGVSENEALCAAEKLVSLVKYNRAEHLKNIQHEVLIEPDYMS